MEDKRVEDIQEMLTDVVDSVRHIHGDEFTNFVMMMTTASQLHSRISGLRSAALDPEHSEEKAKFVRDQSEIAQTLLAAMCANIGNVCKLNDEKVQEGLEWSSKIVDMAYSKFEGLQ
jgi:hypothetical protein